MHGGMNAWGYVCMGVCMHLRWDHGWTTCEREVTKGTCFEEVCACVCADAYV